LTGFSASCARSSVSTSQPHFCRTLCYLRSSTISCVFLLDRSHFGLQLS
jgi:hypothetical protein